MNAQDILDMIGDAKDIYVWDAQQVRAGLITLPNRRVTARKIWLIASLVALTILLVGCAVVYALSLSGMKIGQTTHVEPEHYGPNWEIIEESQVTYDVLSVQSFSDSPNQRATLEWNGYKNAFVEDVMDIPLDVIHSVPEIYYSYGCRTPEMMKKLDEIVLNIVLDESFDWPYYVLAELHYSAKGYFDDYTVKVRNLDTVLEWEYPLLKGGTALLALDKETALILVEGKEGFFAMDFDAQMGVDRVSTEMMERIVDLFDFSLIPYSPTDEEWGTAKHMLYAAEEMRRMNYSQWREIENAEKQREHYDEWVRQTLEAGGDITSLGYAFYDIDENGSKELLIGRDGYCEAIFWEKNGKIEQFANAAENLYVCEDGKLVYVLMPGEESFHFVQLEDGTSKGLGGLQHSPGNPKGEYRISDPEKWGVYVSVSKDEYDSILSSYIRVPIPFVPLIEYPLNEPATVSRRSHVYSTNYTSYEEMIRIRLTDQKERWSRWAYDIRDLDNDGLEEMIWREDDRYFLYTMADGAVCQYSMIYDGTVTICEDGMIQAVIHYGPENFTTRFYRLNRGRIELVEYLRYDVDVDAQNPWFRSPDLTGQDITLEPISEMEAKSIIASYDPLEIDMKPIADYPFE